MLTLGSLYPSSNLADMRRAHAELFSKLCVGQWGGANFFNLRRSKPAVPVALSSWAAAFCRAICLIVGMGAGRKMIRVDAGRSIARMEKYFALRDRADKMLVRKAMRPHILAINAEPAVSKFVNASIPNPAGISFCEATEEGVQRSWKRMRRQAAGAPFSHVAWATHKPAYHLLGAAEFARHVCSFVKKAQLCHNHSTV